MMKIVYVVADYTTRGGMERILASKANYFIEYGYEVTIISQLRINKDPFYYFNPHIRMIFLDIGLDEKYKDEYLQELSKHLYEIKPDISISTGIGLGIYLYEIQDESKKIFEYHFSKYKGKPFMVDWDKCIVGRLITDIYKRKIIQRVKHFDSFIVLTHEDRLSWRGISQIEVIPNPLPYPAKEFSNNTAKRVIAVGRLANQKAFHRLIRIWKDVCDLYPDWKLVIFGDGNKKKYLGDLIVKLNLIPFVKILPPTQNIGKEYAESSIFAMTSRHEGQGLVILEAMDANLPTVTYDFKCGPRDMLDNNVDGFIVKEGDSKAFVDKLTLLMGDEQLRKQMGNKARENVQRYSMNNIMPMWIDLFEKLTKK